MEESDETAEIVENTDDVEETDEDVVAELREDRDSGVDTVDSVDWPSACAGSGSGVKSAVILVHAWSGNVPNRLRCSGVR